MTSGHIQFAHGEDGFLFSQTGASKFRLCPEYARVIWTGEHVETFGAEALTGIAAHAAIHAAIGGKDPVLAATEAASDEWERVMFPPGSEDLTLPDVIITAAEAARVGAKIAKKFEAQHLGSEMGLVFDLPYGRHPKHLRGTLDLVLVGDAYEIEIIDWKVSKSVRYILPYLIKQLQAESVQATIYTYLASRRYDVPMSEVAFTFVAVHPETLKIYEVPVRRTEEDIKRLAVELDAICDLWLARLPTWPVAAAGSWNCSERWCSHWDTCIIHNP